MPHIDEQRYPHVVSAVLKDDRDRLSHFGRLGGYATARRNRERRLHQDAEADSIVQHRNREAERLAHQDWLMRMSANEHIIPLEAYD